MSDAANSMDDASRRGQEDMAEAGTSLGELTAAVLAFRDERDWAQFHTPKDVALSLVLEAAEVLELFQWKDQAEVAALLASEAGRSALAAELADVLSWVLLLAHDQGIDLAAALRSKLAENTRKYPVDRARGRADKYTEHA
jgi:NTP pyrophosphatase (non-canonical NTP hydrolase)